MDEQLHSSSEQRFVQVHQSQLSLFASCFLVVRLPFDEAGAATGLLLFLSPTQTPSMQLSERQAEDTVAVLRTNWLQVWQGKLATR
jgi:hypothetical protein